MNILLCKPSHSLPSRESTVDLYYLGWCGYDANGTPPGCTHACKSKVFLSVFHPLVYYFVFVNKDAVTLRGAMILLEHCHACAGWIDYQMELAAGHGYISWGVPPFAHKYKSRRSTGGIFKQHHW